MSHGAMIGWVRVTRPARPCILVVAARLRLIRRMLRCTSGISRTCIGIVSTIAAYAGLFVHRMLIVIAVRLGVIVLIHGYMPPILWSACTISARAEF